MKSKRGELREGRVIWKTSRSVRVRVEGDDGVLECRLPPRRRDESDGDGAPAVGDRVEIRCGGGSDAVVERIRGRSTELRRSRTIGGRDALPAAGRGRATREKVVAANVDQVLLVLAARAPAPRWGLVDRVIVSAQYEGIAVGLAINKWDQIAGDAAAAGELEENAAIYERLGYPVFFESFLERGVSERLQAWLRGRLTVLSGHSGVGKSTLLTRLVPDMDIATGEISEATSKGRHVTTSARLYETTTGDLIDTPGYREFGVVDIDPAQLGLYFPEMEPHVSSCRFKDCLHRQEPGCAVTAARETGAITPLRYRNYLQILASLE